ncbi:accessory gland protein Acp76A [Drosophila elegans]|uniref:accessory gland protein Acp76A n=1 Tax=Drosophila elegans TaxID=30023 RepID=UPI0007E87F69|nr:accessory gland protein Acp76A [Drosophila elegans]
MAKLQLAFSVLCVLLYFCAAQSQNRSLLLFKEIGSQTERNYILFLFDIEMILFKIYAGKASLNDAKLSRDLITGLGNSEVKKEMQALASRFRKASRAKFWMANRVFVPQEDPLSKKISMIFSLLMASARKHDYAKDIKTARTVNQWVLDNVDRVLTDYAKDKREKRAKQLVALSGMSLTPQWSIRFKSQVNRYFAGRSKAPICVPMMHSLLKMETMSTDEAKGIFIKFETTDIGILFLLPRKGVTCQNVLDNLGTQIRAELDDPIDVNLMIPIFKAEFESDISSKLAKINMAKVFNGTQFYLESNMKIDEFMQKTKVEIRPRNILTKVNDINMQNITTFELNRPFVFVIKDKDYIYAVGRIDDMDGLASTGNCSKKYSDLD